MLDGHEKPERTERLRSLLPLLRELNDLKRLYAVNLGGSSLATRVFRGACQPLSDGRPLEATEWTTTLLAAARLGAISPEVLASAGLSAAEARAVFDRSIDAHECLSTSTREGLKAHTNSLDARLEGRFDYPDGHWADRLCRSPRAGATCPGKPRIALEPAEMHSDHCGIVAVYGYLIADSFGANPEDAWLIGLCHHFHNAYLPDAGFTGEVLLGDSLDRVIGNFRAQALQQVHASYRHRIETLFAEIAGDTTPLAQTFHAADTIDRVVQMENYERAARFRVSQALDDLDLVHEGPVQAFQKAVLESVGLISGSNECRDASRS